MRRAPSRRPFVQSSGVTGRSFTAFDFVGAGARRRFGRRRIRRHDAARRGGCGGSRRRVRGGRSIRLRRRQSGRLDGWRGRSGLVLGLGRLGFGFSSGSGEVPRARWARDDRRRGDIVAAGDSIADRRARFRAGVGKIERIARHPAIESTGGRGGKCPRIERLRIPSARSGVARAPPPSEARCVRFRRRSPGARRRLARARRRRGDVAATDQGMGQFVAAGLEPALDIVGRRTAAKE